MKDKSYWKQYCVETNPEEIQQVLTKDFFISGQKEFELLRLYKDKAAENILITPGSSGHAYVFAELAYLIHKQGYNVFIMPKHGGFTISALLNRHIDAVKHIQSKYRGGIHLFGEGLGGLVVFYLALSGLPVQSIICENAPAILTDKDFHAAMKKDGPAGKRRSLLMPFFSVLVKIFPALPVPVKTYLAWNELIDFTDDHNRVIEERLIKAYNLDPDFDNRYPLKAVMSLVNTPPPQPVSTLFIPTLFILAKRGVIPGYIKALFMQLPGRQKKLVEVDGGVFWMVSNPSKAANTICGWVREKTEQKKYSPIES